MKHSPIVRSYLRPEGMADILGLRFLEDGTEGGGDGSTPGGKTYSEDYVKSLRQEAAGYRTSLRNVEAERDALKTERDTLSAKITEIEAKSGSADALVAAADARALRLEVALEKGLPLALARRLDGNTRDEIVADADELKKLAGATGTANFDQGNTPPPPSAPDVNGSLRAIAGLTVS